MKNKFLTVYSVFISIIFIFSLSFFTLNLIYEYSHGLERTKRRFSHLETMINVSTDEKQIENSIGNLNDFSYLRIFSGGNTIFVYPSESSIQNPETKLVKNYNTNNFSNKFYIEASLYTLRPSTIHYYAKISFLLIILATTLTLIIIICLSLTDESSKSIVKIEELEDAEQKVDSGSTDFDLENSHLDDVDDKIDDACLQNTNAADSKEKCNESIGDEADDVKIGGEKKTDVENKKDMDSDFSDLEGNISDIKKSDEETKDMAKLPEDQSRPVDMTEDAFLQNKNSDEELLEIRLEKELNRAIASEIDISLFMIRVPEIAKENSDYQKIYEKLVEDFQYKDLIFEVNSDCFAAIKLNTDIDEAISFADSINHDVDNLISDENKVCFIGIASRTLRMVSAKRLIHESKEALVHAQQDSDTPIVAFKVDSEKYMKMMENN